MVLESHPGYFLLALVGSFVAYLLCHHNYGKDHVSTTAFQTVFALLAVLSGSFIVIRANEKGEFHAYMSK